MYDPLLVKMMDDEAARFAPYLDARIKAVFNDPKFRATGSTAGSVITTVTKTNGDQMPVITVEFNAIGNIINKNKIYWAKLPRVKELMDWLLQSGKINSFSVIPGYKNSSGLSPEKKAHSIAWAIAKNKLIHDTWHPKKWRSKTMKQVLQILNEQCLQIWKDFIEERMFTALQTGK